MRSSMSRGPRLRTAILTAVLLVGTFAVNVAPVTLPGPLDEALGPQPVQAGFCATNAAFTGRLTASSASTTALSRTTSTTAYGYISNVQTAWSCTIYYRYSGMAYNTTSTLGTFRWGNLINSDSVSCNYVVGSTDYIKGNATSDCPDTDAEYALPLSLGSNGIFQRDVNHDSDGDFSFIQTDCGTYYGGVVQNINGETFATANTANRPGVNCDPLATDDTSTTQTIILDSVAPVLAFVTPATTTYRNSAGAYTVSHTVTEAVAGFGGSNVWKLQRQIATISATPGTCNAFANDPAAGNLTTGTSTGTINTSQTLVAARCYRWVENATDQNGNVATQIVSPTVLVDVLVPAPNFSSPNENTTTVLNVTSYTVAWTETDIDSGVASRSLQRRIATWSGTACGTYANDGSASSAASPVAVSGLVTDRCYQWIQTLTDRAGNTGSSVSGIVRPDPGSPSTDFSTPNEGTTTITKTSPYSVAWTESAPSPNTITSRSLQRWKVAVSSPNVCPTTGWATDGSADTHVSAISATGMNTGFCYRWVQTLTNSVPKTTGTTSGNVLFDTTAPTGTIVSPAANAPLAGPVTITGTAIDAYSFKEYQLEYGAGATPGSWTTIGTFTSQVPTTATLATWDPGTLSGVYTIRLTVRDNAANTAATVTRTIVLENAERGDEAFYSRVPFDLGGGWGLDVGVHNGEARLSRDLFSIPSYGPSQALGLSYSSLETGTAGRFGVGWNSNLTQYLTFDVTTVGQEITTWHRADGGRVPFGKVAGVWTALAGHHEVLSVAGSEVTITATDQTKNVFYDAATGAGRLKRIENRFAKALTLAWSASSATATNASGVTNLVIDAANNRITSVTDSAGRVWGFGYTGTALTSVTDPASKVTTLAYTGGLLTSVSRVRTKAAGGTDTIAWTIGYTGGKATAVTDPVAATTASTFTYTSGSTDVGLLRETSPAVVRDTSTYVYDVLGRVTELTDPLAFVTDTTYDPASNPTAIARPIGTDSTQSTTTYTYDAVGNVLTETVPIDGSTSVVTVNTYNASNDLLTRTDADNDSTTRTVTKYGYDGSGHLISVNMNCTTSGTTPPGSGAGGTCTGAGTQDAATNLISSYAYTANHQLAYEQDPLGRVTKHVFDTYGNEISTIVDCTTSGTSTPSPFDSCTAGGTLDAQTNVTTSSTFDAATTAGKAGLATKTTDPLGRDTTFTYDALGRQLTEVSPGDSSIPVLTRTTTYDELGEVLTETDGWTPIGGGSAVSRMTTHVYDLAGHDTSVTDNTGVATTTTYDLVGNTTSTTVDGVTTTRTYDGARQVSTETGGSGDGGITIHTYDAQGNEISLNAAGSQTDRAYDRQGRLLTEAVDNGEDNLTTSHAYDPLGRELTTTDPIGLVTTQTYDRAGRALTSQVAGGPLVTTTYDRVGNAVASLGADSKVSATLVDPLNRVVRAIANCTNTGTTVPAAGATCAGTGTADASTNLITYTYYDAAGTPVAGTDPKGITARTISNVRGLAATSIANCTDDGSVPPSTSDPAHCVGDPTSPPAGTNLTTTSTYDGSGQVVVSIRDVVGAGDVRTEQTFDDAGRLTKTIVDAGGLDLTTEIGYDAEGRQVATKDPRGTITRTFYDTTTGQVTKTVVDCTTSGTTIPTDWVNCMGAGTVDGTYNLTTVYEYDAAGNRTAEIAPNGRRTTFDFDPAGRLIQREDNQVDDDPATRATAGVPDDLATEYAYDDAGRQVAVRAPILDGSTFSVTKSDYDARGRLSREVRNCISATVGLDWRVCDGTGSADAQTNVVTTYTYDGADRRITLTAPDPSAATGGATATVTTQYAYDATGRQCRVVENATGSTDLQTLTDPCSTTTQTAATTSTNLSTRYTYDAAGNMASMVDANGNTTSYGYDASGAMTSVTDAMGPTTTYEYDEAGNRTRQTIRSTPPYVTAIDWTYDAVGQILSRVADGITTTYTYDASGNRLCAGTGATCSSASDRITSTYDRLNRPLTVSVSADAGAGTTYTYSLTSPAWTDPTGSYTATLDKFDRQLTVNDPVDATDFTWSYRADGQVAATTQPNGNATDLSYDALGQVTGSDTDTTPGVGGTDRAVYGWTYNRAGQVLSEASTITADPANGIVNYAYDPLGRLITAIDPVPVTTTYGWDKDVNRTSVQVGAGGTTATTAYNAADRPISGTNPTASYQSDGDGRLTVAPGYRYEWDHLGRLSKVKPPTGNNAIAIYSYDPLDRLRLVDYGGSNRIRFRYTGLTTNAAQLVNDASGTVTLSIANGWPGERLLDWTGSGSNLRFYGTNSHHDTTWLASSTGVVSQALRYDPWGSPRSSAPSGYSPFRFQGSWFDDQTILSWVVSRWYAPALGRFISEDGLLGEMSDPPSRHLYAYGAGDPVGRWDPDGQRWCIRCTVSTLYHGAQLRVWTHSLKNPLHARGIFKMTDFIRTKWVFAPFTNGLKGDWRDFWGGFNCIESRACMEVDFNNNRVTVTVQPSCERKGSSDWVYTCKNALDINAPWPFVNAVNFVETSLGKITLGWSLNQSIILGAVPIDGRLELTPPGGKDWYGRAIPSKVRVVADGYPSLELLYQNRSYKPVYQDYEGNFTDLGPGMERDVTKSWPTW